MSEYEVPDNVDAFLEASATIIGKAYADRTSTVIHSQCSELESPIEQLFLIAFNTVAEASFRSVKHQDYAGPFDLVIIPQHKVGPYKIDFLAYQHAPEGVKPPCLAIECDGHDFHDQDKRQRSYEKRRDRDLQRAGLKVFRFTGSDIVADPYKCAAEVIAELTGDTEASLLSDIHQFAGGTA